MTDHKPALDDAYALQSPQDNQRLYAAWADTYDSDFAAAMDYQLPLHVVQRFLTLGGQGPALDVGAGTGIVGQLFQANGPLVVDGTDISREMLAVAQAKGCYRSCFWGDLTDELPVADNCYRAVVSSGTFTTGHVGPSAFHEWLRVTARDGLVCVSVNAAHWQARGFADMVDELAPAIYDISLVEVPIYGPKADGSHKDDVSKILAFRKR